jgi:cell wall integrity and stress response component
MRHTFTDINMLDSYFKLTRHLLLLTAATTLFTALPVSAQNLNGLGCYTDADGKLASRYLYQSSSYCYNNCTDYHYFYIQNVNCYCTNTKPTTQGTCNIRCPGFGTDTCGGPSSYNYWENLLYIGTDEGLSSGISSASSSTKTKTTQSTTGTSMTATQSSTHTTSTETSQDSSETSSTSTGLETITNSAKETVFVTKSTVPSGSTTPSQSAPVEQNKSGGISGGAIAGIVVGVFGGIAALVAILIFWKRRNNQSAYTASRSPNHFVDPFGARAEDKMAFSHAPPDAFMAIDQRLNPVMLGERRLSEGSIADERDYSRKILRVANPDD